MMFSGMIAARGPERALRPVGVPPAGEAVDLALVEILDRVEAAVHVAIERGIADRHLRLVAGGQHHRPELVRDRHQHGAARPRLQVLLGDGRRRCRRRAAAARPRNPRPAARSARCRSGRRAPRRAPRRRSGSRSRCSGRAASRSGRAPRPSASTAIAAHDRRVDAAGEAEDDAREAVLVDIVAQAHDAGAPVRLLALGQRSDAARPGSASRRPSASR